MKALHYFFLSILLPLAVSCVQDADDIQPISYSQEEVAYNVLQLTETPILFGKATIGSNGKWKEGWILTKYGKVMEVEYTEPMNPVAGLHLVEGQLELMIEKGKEIFQLENQIQLADHYLDLEDIPTTMTIERSIGDSYFAIVQQEFAQPEDADAQGCNNGDIGPYSFLAVKMLATPNEILDHKEAIETMNWLNNLENQLN